MRFGKWSCWKRIPINWLFCCKLRPPFGCPKMFRALYRYWVRIARLSEWLPFPTPSFNPRVVCIEEKDGYLEWAFARKMYTRRQEAEPVYRINGMLYIWRRDYLMRCSPDQLYARRLTAF